jgi:hypothetical protein
MPYIGKENLSGQYALLDSITTDGSSSYTMQLESVNYEPETERNMIVSVNGVTQAPGTAYTISGSTITFTEALTSSDAIDYILILGNVFDIGTPSDNTVRTSSIQDDAVTSAKLAHVLTITDLTVSNTFTQGVGDYIQNRYVMHGTTTDDTETEIFRVNTNGRVPIEANTTVFYEASFAARRTDATGESAAWHLKGCADNFNGTVADVGTIYEIAVAQDDVTLAVDIRADDTNDSVDVFVTGANNKSYSWTTVITTVEVSQ